jgi:hypothetical protein
MSEVSQVLASPTYKYIYPHESMPPAATKVVILTRGGVAIISDWQNGLGHVAWAPLPSRDKLKEKTQ